MLSHFASLVVGHGEALLRINLIRAYPQAVTAVSAVAFIILTILTKSVVRSTKVPIRDIASAFDQVVHPVARNDAPVDLRWALMNADHVGDRSPTIFTLGMA